MDITRAEYERAVSDLIESTIDPVARASWREEFERSKGVVETPQAQAVDPTRAELKELTRKLGAIPWDEETFRRVGKLIGLDKPGTTEARQSLSADQLAADIASFLAAEKGGPTQQEEGQAISAEAKQEQLSDLDRAVLEFLK